MEAKTAAQTHLHEKLGPKVVNSAVHSDISEADDTSSRLSDDAWGEQHFPDLWLHPGLAHYGDRLLDSDANFRESSSVDILMVSGEESRAGK